MAGPVFTDASSAILLEKAGLFTTVSKAFSIIFPASVFKEISRPGYPGSAFFSKALENGRVDVVLGSEKNPFGGCPQKNEMDAGERDTLSLFLDRKQGFILTDDGRAAAWCRDHGLPFINALLVPKILGFAGWINLEDSMDKMELLCRIGRYSQKIKDLAFSFTKKDLALFIPEKKMKTPSFDAAAWRKKAGAFVIRCHHHLFGKNNEDPLAYLFTRGIKNEFAKKLLLGWNKFSQERPRENWGFEPGPEKLILQKGLVIPYIVEKELKSVFIYPYEPGGGTGAAIVPGSACTCMILENDPGQGKKEAPVLVHDLMQGLLLFQEKKEAGCIIIHPDPKTPLDEEAAALLQSGEKTGLAAGPGFHFQIHNDHPGHDTEDG